MKIDKQVWNIVKAIFIVIIILNVLGAVMYGLYVLSMLLYTKYKIYHEEYQLGIEKEIILHPNTILVIAIFFVPLIIFIFYQNQNQKPKTKNQKNNKNNNISAYYVWSISSY